MLGEAQLPAVSNAWTAPGTIPTGSTGSPMIPALVGTLTMTTVLFVIVMSVARERELGTFEQLLGLAAAAHSRSSSARPCRA